MKYCTDCGKPKEEDMPCLNCYKMAHLDQPKSHAWYLLPILFSLVGGLIMYAGLRNKNRKKAKRGMILGFGLTIFYLALLIAIASTFDGTEPDRQLGEDEIRAMALSDINLDEISENIDDYRGKIIHATGTIRQIEKGFGDTYYLNVNVDNQGDQINGIILKHDTSQEPVPFSKIDFYAEVTGVVDRSSLLTGATLHFVEATALVLEVTS